MGHVDRSEVCSTSPLVSVSYVFANHWRYYIVSDFGNCCHTIRLGHAAIFLIGGLSRDEEPIPILLRSGDVVVMSGPQCRRAYHGK